MTPDTPPPTVAKDLAEALQLLSNGQSVQYQNPELATEGLPEEAVAEVAREMIKSLEGKAAAVEVQKGGIIIFHPHLDSHQVPNAIGVLLDTFRQLVAKPKNSEGELVLVVVPREVALQLVGEYAEAAKKSIPMHQLRVIQDYKVRHLILVIDGIPVLAAMMAAPMMCAYVASERFGSLRGAEEHPVYPGVLFNKRLADTEPRRLPKLSANCIAQAITITSSIPASAFLPLPPAVIAKLEEAKARKPQPKESPSGALPMPEAEALEAIREGLKLRKDDILGSIKAPNAEFKIHLAKSRQSLVASMRDMIEDMMPEATTSAKISGDVIEITIMRRLIK